LEDLLVRYGALGVFLGTALEGDLTALLAGVIAHLGLLDLRTALVTTWLGGVAGDVLWYAVGRTGAAAIRSRPVYARVAPLIERVAGRIGPWEVAVSRFLYGAHTASMLFWGVHRLPASRFLALSLLGCGLWAGVFVGLGYVLSNSATVLIGRVKRVERWLAGAIIVAAAGVLVLRAFMRRLQRAPERLNPPEPGGRP
jgi:membrane protein DedA with SNARE-associated domain